MQNTQLTYPKKKQQTNQNHKNQRGLPRNFFTINMKYTPLGEPMEIFMHKLIQMNLIKLPNQTNYKDPNFQPPWYNENYQCVFHRIKGHKKNN